MIRYIVTHSKLTKIEDEGYWNKVDILESDKPISRKEIANRLDIGISEIIDIKEL